MIDEETIEKIDIIRLQGREVKVFVDIGSPAVDHSQGTLTLCIHALENMRYEASEVLGDAFVRIE